MKGKAFMLKSVQIRIILIIIVLAIVMFVSYGLFSIQIPDGMTQFNETAFEVEELIDEIHIPSIVK